VHLSCATPLDSDRFGPPVQSDTPHSGLSINPARRTALAGDAGLLQTETRAVQHTAVPPYRTRQPTSCARSCRRQ